VHEKVMQHVTQGWSCRQAYPSKTAMPGPAGKNN
jgi:hypothetical protein